MYKIEDQIIQKLKKGKKEAFEIIFATYYSNLHSYAYSFVKDEDVAYDIVQDVFTVLWEKRHQITMLGFINAYLFRSVQNKCLNYIEHERIKNIHIGNSQNQQYAANISFLNSLGGENGSIYEKELTDLIDKTINALPDKCRQVFKLSRGDGLKNREVAEKLNISIKGVEKHIKIALSRLRIALDDYLPVLFLLLINAIFHWYLYG
jgi:RNA polymerase sigma-70 factor (ECF subfamily)